MRTHYRDLAVGGLTFESQGLELDSSGLIWHNFTLDFEKMCLNT